jgi:hypothetical protein
MLLTRRKFLGISVLGLSTKWYPSSAILAAGAPDETRRKIRWRVPKAHLDTVMKNLRFEGTVEKETDIRGAPLVFVFVGAVVLTYLADAVLALRRAMVYGGVVIDTRGPEIVIENDIRLDAGVIVVISPSGVDLYEPNEIGDPSSLAAALLKGK